MESVFSFYGTATSHNDEEHALHFFRRAFSLQYTETQGNLTEYQRGEEGFRFFSAIL
jgi:hypothetical protein